MPFFRVVLADKQKLFLQSLRKNIGEIPGIEVIEEVYSGINLLEIIKKTTIDMIIIDVENLQDLEAVKEIKQAYPKIKILILSMIKSKELLLQAILANVDGYMFTENAYSDLIKAIQVIRQGESYFCNISSVKMAEIIREQVNQKYTKKALSKKEISVLRLRCEGKSFKNIAEDLSIGTKTVASHMTNIRKKLNLRTLPDLLRYAIEMDIYHDMNIRNGR